MGCPETVGFSFTYFYIGCVPIIFTLYLRYIPIYIGGLITVEIPYDLPICPQLRNFEALPDG
jgi:hypothetical protein